VELAVLVGRTLSQADAATARAAAAGYAVALDLTLREVQAELKKSGQPWEMAKAFDGACPLSPFIRPADLADPQRTALSLAVNGQLRQQGSTAQMMVGIFELMAYISRHFTLLPGDEVLTGTPAGVGPLYSGDELTLSLGEHFTFTARIA
ncbi:MAG: fumarylacetoacetate hydrolase family protein, partial [Pseudomonadota bacterium]|nr:fumarylacetoacetate hydrolase family protein [Pseudomonadota bacterium]